MIRYVSSAILVAAAFTLTAAAPQQSTAERQEARLAKALDGLTPGKPVTCLPMDRVTEVKGYEGTILYVQGKNKLWRNETSGGCEGLGRRDDILVSRTTSRQYCRGDIIQTRARTGGHFTGACSLGDFVPYTKTN
jgi:hypothetical protein